MIYLTNPPSILKINSDLERKVTRLFIDKDGVDRVVVFSLIKWWAIETFIVIAHPCFEFEYKLN